MEKRKGRPADCAARTKTENDCYDLLDALGVEYERVDHAAAETMEQCEAVEEVLHAPICKNLVLANRRQTAFYLLLMPGDKPFKTKDLSEQLGVARLSFALPEQMERLLGTAPGSASVLGLMNDRKNEVQLLIDRDVLDGEWFGCHPCKNTSTLRISVSDLTGRVLPALHHVPVKVKL